MIFKKMIIKNFRQYKGDHTIEFSTDREKNVTIILGNNGSGKTTLLQAFNWCLYDKVKLDDPDMLLNQELANSLLRGASDQVEVTIEFEHLGKTYNCRKIQTYERSNDGNIKKYGGYQTVTIKDPSTGETRKIGDSIIREIFPNDLSVYFLFDGERMQNLADNQKIGKKDLTLAVTNLLGLDVIKNSITHLNRAKREFETEYVTDNSSRIEVINNELENLDNRLTSEEANKSKFEDEIIELESKLSTVNEIIKSYSAVKELQNSRLDYQKQIEKTDFEIEMAKKDYYAEFAKSAPFFFLDHLYESVIEGIKNSELGDKGIEGINSDAVNFLIKRGHCICGTAIKDGTQELAKLNELLKYLPPASYSVLLKGLEVEVSNYMEKNNIFYDYLNKQYEKYNNLMNHKHRLISKEEEINKKILEVGDTDVSKYDSEYRELREKISFKQKAIGSTETQIEFIKKQIKSREEERSRITVTSNLNDVVQFKVDICNRLIEDMENRFKNKEKEIKVELQEIVSNLLSEMLHSDKYITIEDDYNFTVQDDFNIKILSEGEKIVTSFAFVGAIISVAKKVLEKEDDSKFTLVMDAPFAKLDVSHRKNVASIIPTLTDQIILFSADSQWDNEIKEALSGKINKMYNLNVEKSGSTRIEVLQ